MVINGPDHTNDHGWYSYLHYGPFGTGNAVHVSRPEHKTLHHFTSGSKRTARWDPVRREPWAMSSRQERLDFEAESLADGN